MCEKKRFANRAEALQRLNEIQTTVEKRDYLPIRDYFCSECGGYHLTSKKMNPKRRKMIDKRRKYFPERAAQQWIKKKSWDK